MKEKAQEVLNEIRKNLQMDGGDVELIEVTDDGVVKVKLKGACDGCPFASQTLQFGIERILKSKIPEVTKVESV